jgi:hypothetical protein
MVRERENNLVHAYPVKLNRATEWSLTLMRILRSRL